jgi:hypothetical protein
MRHLAESSGAPAPGDSSSQSPASQALARCHESPGAAVLASTGRLESGIVTTYPGRSGGGWRAAGGGKDARRSEIACFQAFSHLGVSVFATGIGTPPPVLAPPGICQGCAHKPSFLGRFFGKSHFARNALLRCRHCCPGPSAPAEPAAGPISIKAILLTSLGQRKRFTI